MLASGFADESLRLSIRITWYFAADVLVALGCREPFLSLDVQQRQWRATLRAEVEGVRLKGASQDLDTEGVELTQGTCYGTGSSSDVIAFGFRVTDAADQARRARQKFDADAVASLKKRGQDVVRPGDPRR